MRAPTSTLRGIPSTVLWLGLVSFFTDVSSEMIYPLLPVFLASVLGATALELGLIEGVAEATAAILKMVSGLWTDRVRRRKPFVVAGYSLAGATRPLIGLAQAWPAVLILRFLDRVGKGIRTSPRDALIADVTTPEKRGAAYGFHRAMDHAGAVIGPLIASALLALPTNGLRHVFLWAAVPAGLSLLVLVFGVKEAKASPAAYPREQPKRPLPGNRGDFARLGKPFHWLLGSVFVFTLGNATDAFLLVRMSEAGISTSVIALLWSAHHVVKMLATYHGGSLSDRVGRRTMILSGWLTYALVYAAFALIEQPAALAGVFLAYGLYFGMVEPSERAWVADAAPAELRGTAFGAFHLVVGLGALPASVLFGFIWKQWGAPTAFLAGAVLAALASLGLAFGPKPRPASSQP